MQISRKNFIKSVSVITGGLMFGFNNSIANIISFKKQGFRELRDNIGIFTEKGGTIGWYITDDASAVIDTQFPDSAEHFMNSFREKTSRNIDFLFNTHHHRDHTSGNFFLKKYADTIIAQENCPKFQEKQNKGTENEKMQIYADMTFKNQWQRELGKEIINAQFLGAAHTGGDSIIYFEKANIAHMGDLVFNGVYPFIDLPGGASIESWITVLEKASEMYPEDTLYIFGHAVDDEHITGKKTDLLKMRDYLSALLEYVRKELDAGKSIDEIKKAEHLPGFEHIQENRPDALATNLQNAYDELKGVEVKY